MELEKDKTHEMQIHMESETNNIELFLLLTISGTNFLNTVFDLNDYVISQDTMNSMQNNLVSI